MATRIGIELVIDAGFICGSVRSTRSLVACDSEGEATTIRVELTAQRPSRWIVEAVSTPGQNLTIPTVENLTVRRGDEPQFVAAS
jgi:hypothetical protein